MKHNDDEPVMFGYAASCNISFRGSEDSGYTWWEWRQMNREERAEVLQEFLYDRLGVEVYEEEAED